MLLGRRIFILRSIAWAASMLLIPAAALATPISDGLVLWLDADDAGSITQDAAGQVSGWADKSTCGHHAEQGEAARRPQYVPDALGGRPVVRFGGSAFLNLGRPAGLDFRRGRPFTIAVVYTVRAKDYGTFLSKGGGSAHERAYQLYVAPGRSGAITYGVMRESPRASETSIAIEVCDGSQADVFVNGTPSLSFQAGNASSKADVLIGARREKADNTGTFYPLKGDVAEMLVYNRALGRDELKQLGDYLKAKYSLEAMYVDPDDAARLVSLLATPEAPAQLDAVANSLARLDEQAVPELKSLLERSPQSASAVAELFVRIAEKNGLSAGMAALAAGLLDHDDPFVRGMAEWAIAMKVGGENSGQAVVWPAPEPPGWYEAWSGRSADARLEADWVRQAVSRRIHRDRAKLLASVDAMIARAERMRSDFLRGRLRDESLRRITDELAALRAVREKLSGAASDASDASGSFSSDELLAARCLWIEARRHLRAIVMENPALDFDEVLFVKQFAPHTVRNITRSYSWKHKPGGDICVLADLELGGDVREVIRGRLGPGYVWGVDLWWDADRVVFGYARQPNWPPEVDTADYAIEGTNVFQLRKVHEPLHLFEVNVDGTGLTQRTDDPYWSDFEPTYCAGGDVVFSSDRCARAAECGNDTYDHTNPNLYVLSPEGDVRHLTDNKDIDRYPHSLADGRIAYTHWEYQERHFMEVHALWTLRPDGTMSDTLFKHHMRAPCGLRDTRSVPGSTKLVSIATGHHTFAYGPVVVVDPGAGMNAVAGLEIVTPGVRPQEGPMAGRPVAEGGVPDQGGLYQTPWALSEKCFLVSYSYARPNCVAPAGADSNGFGLYFIDVYGNRELVHRDPVFSCTFPIPLRKRPRPPRVPDVTDRRVRACTHATEGKDRGVCAGTETIELPAGAGKRACEHAPYATCFVPDVYDGMDDIEPGTIKHLRVSQHVGWPFDAERGQMDYIPANAGTRRIDFQSWSPVRVIGTVPVESDGSASFTVPADTGIYFQALDERQMEIRRMRSVVSLKAGEVRGCSGCHESRAAAPTLPGSLPLALKRPPRMPTPPPWGAETMLGYESLVQPILDRHCVRCHGREKPDGDLDFTATRAPDGLYQSFRTMFGKLPGKKEPGRLLVSCSNRFSNADVSKLREFGSHQSPLVRVLLDDDLHKKEVSLDPAGWLTLVTWVDANAPYYDAFFNKRRTDGGEPAREVFPQFPPGVVDDHRSSPHLARQP